MRRRRDTRRTPRTKTLAWRPDDEAALRRLRAAAAATAGVVPTERDLVAAALRLALQNPAALALPGVLA